jgi:predicted  nucleic acid-binding Zn-ribbon protein
MVAFAFLIFFRKLDEKSKAHLLLDRKLATAEAKIVRLESEVVELRDSNEKLIEDHKSLATILKKQPSSKNLENHLENELVKAHTYIGGLEKSCGKIKEKYTTKLR